MRSDQTGGVRRASSAAGVATFLATLLGVACPRAWAQAPDAAGHSKSAPRVVYPKSTQLDFEGARIEGELRKPGEFYFQYRPEEKFDSLVKRRKDFRREMLRDVVLSR